MSRRVKFPRLPRPAQAVVSAVACGTLLAVAGCRIPGTCPPDPAAPVPAGFNGTTTPDSSAQLNIDEFFNDPTLTCLIRTALAGNQELKILAQDVRIAGTEVQARRGLLFPFVTVRADASTEKTSRYTRNGAVEANLDILPGRRFPNPLPNYLVAAEFSWQIDIWRKLRNARDAAGLRYLATAEGRNYVVTRVTAQVAENYYGLLALDERIEVLDKTIAVQERSLEASKVRKAAARDTEVAVQRFQAEVRKNQSEKLIVAQEIIEAENRINFLAGRFPQAIPRPASDFVDLNLHTLSVGVPSQLLLNRADIRQAERELEAAGLEVKVARAEFFPSLTITGGVGYEAFNPRYLFNPEAFAANVAGGLAAPLVNRTAIQAAFSVADARQLQKLYEYQRTVLEAFTEVVNQMTAAENYARSIAVRREQLKALELAVSAANQLFLNARGEYQEVLLAQRDLFEARTVLIQTKRQQLVAIVNAYQALGGGGATLPLFGPDGPHDELPPLPAGPPKPPAPVPAPPGEPLPPPAVLPPAP